jgi:hypothetical protein
MNLTPEIREQVAMEVKRFAADLYLSSAQKEKLQNAFQDSRGKLGDYMQQHPNVTKAEIGKELMSRREEIRRVLLTSSIQTNLRSGIPKSVRPRIFSVSTCRKQLIYARWRRSTLIATEPRS